MEKPVMALRMTITWDVLEGAKDVGDEMVIAACRRVIEADRRGWRKHRAEVAADFQLVMDFAD
jgi:hypothetical protein